METSFPSTEDLMDFTHYARGDLDLVEKALLAGLKCHRHWPWFWRVDWYIDPQSVLAYIDKNRKPDQVEKVEVDDDFLS